MAKWDVFISYASEDRDAVAAPLAVALRDQGLRVWIDEEQLEVGASLLGEIGKGIAESTWVVAVVSRNSLSKRWPGDELAGAFERERLLIVLHGLTIEELTSMQPVLAGRKLLVYDGANLPEIVRRLAGQIGPDVEPEAPGAIYVDLSHGQDDWWHLAEAFADRSRFTCLHDAGTGLILSEAWKSGSVLIAPPPLHQRWERPEVEEVRLWVEKGGGLLVLGHYAGSHHGCNMELLAWAFDFDFRDDLLMPSGSTSANRSVASRSAEHAVRAPIPDGAPFEQGADDVCLLHACSVLNNATSKLAFRVSAPPGTQSWRPIGRRLLDGNRPNIESYELGRVASGPEVGDTAEAEMDLVLARTWGQGRVAIAGTWKIFTVEDDATRSFADGLIGWLGGDG